ncbi:cytochrome c biogenesis protein CcdC [Paenibacillus glycanilyticus]|uniref:CcdC protein domain-containing protein n=1 Tax=Paenibacillus glycanilyticus TaxID=126569 RepID=UPI00203E357B|nr:CcdC protein domain-containing protein [Paenibacillus glycanilyticus]MCM3626001.1 cytochrome c biogenesis protein CcdC [Paenibacillus glycanilyticus]
MSQLSSYIIPVLVILFIMYRRFKRSIGFQPFKPGRLKMRIGLFCVIGILLLVTGFPHPAIYLSDALGIACGAVIAYYAIKHSRFEQRDDTLFYRTHVGIETLVVLLFIGRIAFRVIEMFGEGGTMAMNPNLNGGTAQMQQYTNDPLTAATFFLLVAYYIGYYTFILRKSDEKAAVS